MDAVGAKMTSSSGLERDARLTTSTPGHVVSPSEIAMGVVIGRTSEAFDFFVFGIACVLVFPSVFFPFLDRLSGTLSSFAIFGLAFLARPVGTVVFSWLDRRHGRGTKLTIALFLLGGSTMAISFVPGYESKGIWSILSLILFRCGQGVALGGAWDGLASLLALNAPQNRRGWFACIPQLGAPFGFIVASCLFAFFLLNLNEQDFLDWGWRYPFFVAFTINVVALFARLRLVATEEFAHLLERRDLMPAPIVELIRTSWRTIILGAFVPLASFALFHLVTIYPLSYVNLYTHRSPAEFLLIEAGGAVMCAMSVAMSGVLADQIGRRNTVGLCAIATAIFAFIAPFLLGGSESMESIFEMVGFVLLGFSYGQASGSTASNFSGHNRYTGSALTSDIAWLIGAGFAPLVVLASYHLFGLWSLCGYLMSGALCTLAALGFNKRLELRIA